MLKNKLKNKNGMTLVELLVAIVIFSTVVGLAYRIYIDNVKYIGKEEIKTELQNEAQIIDSTFLQLGMQSEGIEKTSLNSTGEFKNGDYVDMKYKNDNDEYRYMRWKLEDNILKLQIINSYDESKIDQIIASEYVLSENIRSFKVSPINNKITLEKSSMIKVDIKLEKRKGFSYMNYPFSIIITFRNKN